MFAETDERGEFTLSDRGKVIFLRHGGYKPVALISSRLSDAVEVTMEDVQESDTQIPSCKQSSNQFDFAGFKLTLPKVQSSGEAKILTMLMSG
jgi:hypothetical protein